jgi:hypothetical protein
MASIVQLKRSALSGKVPGTGSLNLGELALNTYDGKIFFRRSGSTDTVQEVITTNTTNTGSVTIIGTLTATSIVGSISASNGVVSGSSQVISILTSLNAFTASENTKSTTLGALTGSLATTGSNTFVGAQTFNSDITVLGAVNARQFNIGIISSSIMYTSGSNKFGDTTDDTHQFTGSVQVTGSLYVNGSQVGIAPGPNTYDFNLDPNAAGTVNYITDSTSNTLALAQTGSFDVKISNITRLSVSSSAMWVTTGSITSNYMHLAKYINTAGDLDFNI